MKTLRTQKIAVSGTTAKSKDPLAAVLYRQSAV